MKEFISTYPEIIEIPIAWGDMDAFQHVNNVVYFRFFESSRISYLEKIAMTEYMTKTNIGPILGSTQCRFKIPLTYPDQISVGAKVDTIEEDRFTMKYAVFSHAHQQIAAIGEGVVVMYDYKNNTKVAVPEEIKKRITNLEKGF